MSKEVPDSVLIALPDTGHMAMFTKPDEVIEAIKQAAQLSIRSKYDAQSTLSKRYKTKIKGFHGAAAPKGFETTNSVPVFRLVLGVAVPAVDRPALSWLERDLGLLTAVRASNIVHLAWPIVPGAAVAAPTLVSVHY